MKTNQIIVAVNFQGSDVSSKISDDLAKSLSGLAKAIRNGETRSDVGEIRRSRNLFPKSMPSFDSFAQYALSLEKDSQSLTEWPLLNQACRRILLHLAKESIDWGKDRSELGFNRKNRSGAVNFSLESQQFFQSHKLPATTLEVAGKQLSLDARELETLVKCEYVEQRNTPTVDAPNSMLTLTGLQLIYTVAKEFSDLQKGEQRAPSVIRKVSAA